MAEQEDLERQLAKVLKNLPRPEKVIKLSEEAQNRLDEARNNPWWKTEGG
ncbi:hypothetical protein LCGC14_2030120 [marine sediment metagenome]|uniref:Uncharacterized protein n=1 Tax=marine sediment metagenome TaxID=412755 RepID=A0A0F9EV49_9ZZZZ